MRQNQIDMIKETKKETAFDQKIREFEELKELVETKLITMAEKIHSFESAISSNTSTSHKSREAIGKLSCNVQDLKTLVDDLSTPEEPSEGEDEY